MAEIHTDFDTAITITLPPLWVCAVSAAVVIVLVVWIVVALLLRRRRR